MIAYLDSSIVLRFVLGRSDRLKQWREIDVPIASALLEVECLRTLDRLRLNGEIAEEHLVVLREKIFEILSVVEVVEVSRAILSRAAQPFPVSLGTLDAVHLATALLWAESQNTPIVMATHDEALGRAARACGLEVFGLSSE